MNMSTFSFFYFYLFFALPPPFFYRLTNEDDSSDVIRLEFIAYENGRFFVPSGEYTGSFQKV